ncbi:iron ABC transporter ATP-binding protein [Microbacterium sp. STN6]|uniref:iron ABC transporter ATP-binding protein n=1 Tax=Microbacterium sp. STN6 TaxID=2995588 RepID=UPI002260A917|nr:iron ABC transporter ATP-binding protein [Microbacterium sp. STN6]MCX7521152.1 iron ABC transporter ATP-binding protein [Microbacterium sp. STN6]
MAARIGVVAPLAPRSLTKVTALAATHRPLASRLIAAAVLGLVGTALLAACASTPETTHSPSSSTTSKAKPGKTHSDPPVASSTPTPKPTPVTLSCDQLMTRDQVYALPGAGPNIGTDPAYAPEKDSLAATIVADAGVACGWMNQTSNDKIAFAVARPAASELDALKDKAISSSDAVPTYGVPPEVEGYFTARGGVGEVQVFSHGYWIVGTSTTFLEPGEPAPWISDMLGNLPAS